MSFTRIHDDPERITQYLEQDYNINRYMLNVPGNGTKPYFIDDPYIRLQKFGGNISQNVVNVNSGLEGVARQLDSNCPNKPNPNNILIQDNFQQMNFPVISSTITHQPRATMPAWELRGLERTDWNYLFTNPQNHAEVLFENNLSSRILEKDSYNSMCSNNPQIL